MITDAVAVILDVPVAEDVQDLGVPAALTHWNGTGGEPGQKTPLQHECDNGAEGRKMFDLTVYIRLAAVWIDSFSYFLRGFAP